MTANFVYAVKSTDQKFMGKQLLAILIISSIAWHILAEAAVYLSFKINQDYIEKYLCVNRDNPESACHGCCQLKKELQEQHETKSEMPDNQVKKIEIQYFPISSKDISLLPLHVEKQKSQRNVVLHPFGGNEIFHPPKKHLLSFVLS
ncbi:hypothetical protein [Mangrovibacterium lignilyticum]|uniref:hypothetical protein n=1 Tax=Mangrovibacterium lignilyticum TaxID=2668052 RepID=UPI0013D5AB0F|nr:hypothetical protein [Mangrovibacterium lignilyticum]